jgi:signal transduction histidine kinase
MSRAIWPTGPNPHLSDARNSVAADTGRLQAARLRVLEALAIATDFAGPCAALAQEAREILGVPAAIFVFDSQTGHLCPFAGADVSVASLGPPEGRAIDRQTDLLSLALSQKVMMVCEDADQSAREIAIRCVQPVLAEAGEPLGAIALFQMPAGGMGEADRSAMAALAAIGKIAMEHDRRIRAFANKSAQLDAIATALHGVIYQRVLEPDGRIHYTYISDYCRTLFGVEAQAVLANADALFARHADDYRARFRENLERASREMRLWDVEAHVVSTDGNDRYTHARAIPHRRGNGAVVWDGVILDTTTLKQANIELAAASKAKTEFLANMSHELRTPLNSIIGFSDLMQGERFGPLGNERYRQYATAIGDSGKHLLSLINDILDISRIELGRTELNEQAINVQAIVLACLEFVRLRAEEGGVELVTEISEGLPELRADERRIKQVILNLLSNALKFTPKGGRITIRLSRETSGEFMISIADTGIGMKAEDVLRVGQPFVQLDAGKNRKFEGTGLGLALVKGMVALHGGMLNIQSAPGKGTTVTVRLPAERVVKTS